MTAVAVLGLVVTPLLHAEQHVREEREDEAETSTAADAWRAGSTNPLDRLAFALEHVHDSERAKSAREQQHGEQHRHSHGPSGPGPHGSNALAHLGQAMHSPPPLPAILAVAAKHSSPAGLAAQLFGTPRYLISEWSQGPPVDD
jgi:hypothetical protein